MNNKKKSLISAAVGAAILVTGGTTFALWQDAGSIGENAITTGDLALEIGAGAIVQLADFIDENGDWHAAVPGGHPIDATNFKLVPGDSISVTFTDAVTAAGNNIDWEVALIGGLNADTLSIIGLEARVNASDDDITVYLDWTGATGVTNVGTAGSGVGGIDLTFDGVDLIQVTQVRS